jgi:hypothetical protein
MTYYNLCDWKLWSLTYTKCRHFYVDIVINICFYRPDVIIYYYCTHLNTGYREITDKKICTTKATRSALLNQFIHKLYNLISAFYSSLYNIIMACFKVVKVLFCIIVGFSHSTLCYKLSKNDEMKCPEVRARSNCDLDAVRTI